MFENIFLSLLWKNSTTKINGPCYAEITTNRRLYSYGNLDNNGSEEHLTVSERMALTRGED